MAVEYGVAPLELGLTREFSEFCSNLKRPRSRKRCGAWCEPRWDIGEWSACSRTCFDGEHSIKTRTVNCKGTDEKGNAVDVSFSRCETEETPKPESEEICQVENCPPVWISSSWSQVIEL